MRKLPQIKNYFAPGYCILIKLHWRRTLVLLLLCSALFCNCHQPVKKTERNVERSFYYWKSVFHLSAFEKNSLTSLHIKNIYIKFFDVDWDNAANRPLPVAQIKFTDSSFLQQDTIKIIPVVFITNECIVKINTTQTSELADKISNLVKNICAINRISFSEVQIDCDWSELTRNKYFSLLQGIKSQLPNSLLSCTIRLHQIKYAAKTGVPPVDHGMLMAYNMGNLKDPATKNSILETAELKKYTSNLSTYPLPLDVALPFFNWKVLFRQNSYLGLIENLNDSFLQTAFIKKLSANRFMILQDTVFNGYTFKKNDVLRNEESNYEEIISAASAINNKLQTTNCRLSLFHLDSLILKKYSQHEMENIFNSLR